MRISVWSSDVCSSDLIRFGCVATDGGRQRAFAAACPFSGPRVSGLCLGFGGQGLTGGLQISEADAFAAVVIRIQVDLVGSVAHAEAAGGIDQNLAVGRHVDRDRKSTRLNSSH